MYVRYSEVVRLGSIKKWYVFSYTSINCFISQFIVSFSQLIRLPLECLTSPPILYDRGLYHIEISLWTGFYIIGTFVMKELIILFIRDCKIVIKTNSNRGFNNIYIRQLKKEVNLTY